MGGGMRLIVFAMCLALSACSAGIVLAPPPNLYRTGANYPEAQVHPTLRSVEPQIFFMTDRRPEGEGYGTERSSSMAFGAATVKFGRDLDWAELLKRTRSDSDERVASLWVPEFTEIVRFNETPLAYERRDGKLRHLPSVLEFYEEQT